MSFRFSVRLFEKMPEENSQCCLLTYTCTHEHKDKPKCMHAHTNAYKYIDNTTHTQRERETDRDRERSCLKIKHMLCCKATGLCYCPPKTLQCFILLCRDILSASREACRESSLERLVHSLSLLHLSGEIIFFSY